MNQWLMINRGNGEELTSVSQDVVGLLKHTLAAEFEEQPDYFINHETLELLGEQGLEEGTIERLEGTVESYGPYDLGLEPVVSAPAMVARGRAVDEQDQPVPGIRVELVRHHQLTDTDRYVSLAGCAFTRPDGTFAVGLEDASGSGGLELRLLARGGLLLWSQQCEDEQCGTIGLDTLRGQVQCGPDELPLPGATVQICLFEDDFDLTVPSSGVSWDRTDEAGAFRIPIGGSVGQSILIEVEVFAPSGEPLGETQRLEHATTDELMLSVPAPDPDWLNQQESMLAALSVSRPAGYLDAELALD